jgi:hypothetical protein
VESPFVGIGSCREPNPTYRGFHPLPQPEHLSLVTES